MPMLPRANAFVPAGVAPTPNFVYAAGLKGDNERRAYADKMNMIGKGLQGAINTGIDYGEAKDKGTLPEIMNPSEWDWLQNMRGQGGGAPPVDASMAGAGVDAAMRPGGVPVSSAMDAQAATSAALRGGGGAGLGALAKTAGQVAAPIAGVKGIADAWNEQGATTERRVGKTAGNVAAAALPYTTAPLIAAGPLGWAALGAQALGAGYGMFG